MKYNVYAQGPDSSTPSSQNKRVVQTGQTNETHVASETSSLILTKSNAQHEIRLYTSEKRMWHALTGHGPDIVKVKPLDFNCLSIIARFGSQGILQHHLTRLSGQDKRSLPARTDRLHEGGYIIKEQLAVREGNAGLLHTSRCILKRFAEFDSDQTLRPYPTQVDPLSAKKRRRRPLAKGRKDQVVVSEPRPVPQWTADRSVSNQIFDLVDKAGAQGMSMSVSLLLYPLVKPPCHILNMQTGYPRPLIWYEHQESRRRLRITTSRELANLTAVASSSPLNSPRHRPQRQKPNLRVLYICKLPEAGRPGKRLLGSSYYGV